MAVAVALTAVFVAGQETVITPPPNKYSPDEDVKLGRQAAAQVERQMPILHDEIVTPYLQKIGGRLVAAIPPELRHPEFEYTFQLVNVKEINAFALPGGPMFVNRGMIETADDEGEIAGVMAHELSHVVLRHGTAQQSKAAKFEVGQAAGAVLGAILGGGLGQIVTKGTQFGLGTAFLRFSREYEQQADIEGTHIMARAGYDPRDMARVFDTIEHQGGAGGPQWLSDHPNPGNRSEYIRKEAEYLHIENAVRDTRDFENARAHLKTLPPAVSTEEATRNASGASRAGAPVPSGRVEPPANEYRTYREGRTFDVSVPVNWREQTGASTVTFAPDGAYTQSGFTHGIELGLSRTDAPDLQTATDDLIASLARSNPDMRRPSRSQPVTLSGRRGLETVVSNRTPNASETVAVFTALMPDGNLFYALCVAPASVFDDYQPAFNRIIESLRLGQ